MRVPQSPRTLHRIMSVVSDDDSTNSDSDGANAMNGSEALSSGCHFKKSKRAQEVSSTSRPPRPTYTTKFKDGKYTVGVEAPLLVTKDLPATEQQESSGLHRSRERTRLSAVQRLVERRLAQKEKDRLKERDQERDLRLASLGSSSRSSSFSSLARDRSWERSKLTGSNGSTSAECAPASAPWRARSCSATRFCTNSSEEDVAKTYISIGPGRPTRIREHSPSKKSPTVEQLPSDFSDDADVRAAKTQNTSFKSSRSSSALRTSSPLKSTGLFREFSSPSLASLGGSGCKSVGSDMGQVGSDKVRKSSFTTEKTFTVNTSSYRKVSLDCNYVYERSPPTVSSFSQADKMTANINPNSSSSFSSSSSSSASSMTSSLSSESLDDQPGDLPKGFTSQVPLRQRKSSSRMFTTTPLPSLNGSSNQDSESGCDTSSCRSSLSSNDSFSGGSGYFSSASSRLLYNISSGYRFHRAAAAAAGVHSEVQENGDDIVTAANQINNLNNKIKVEDAYPRRRFSQEHVDSVQEQQGAVHLESLPSRKISLPVRPSRDMYHRETKRSDLRHYSKGANGGGGDGDGTVVGEKKSSRWSLYTICDDTLNYPGCCVKHNRLSLATRSSGGYSHRHRAGHHYPLLAQSVSKSLTLSDWEGILLCSAAEKEPPLSQNEADQGATLRWRIRSERLDKGSSDQSSEINKVGGGFFESDGSTTPTAVDDDGEEEGSGSNCESTVSGSGLLFLKNYLKTKMRLRNVHFLSTGRGSETEQRDQALKCLDEPVKALTELLNDDDTFDTDDSELENLDWEVESGGTVESALHPEQPRRRSDDNNVSEVLTASAKNPLERKEAAHGDQRPQEDDDDEEEEAKTPLLFCDTDDTKPSPGTKTGPLKDARSRLAHLWETERVAFRPVMPSYYDPKTHWLARERIQQFIEATRKAAEQSHTLMCDISTNL